MSEETSVLPAVRWRFEDIEEGMSAPACRFTMDQGRYDAYNQLIHEINPLHFDKGFAQGLGFEDIVVAGVYTFSFIPLMIEALLEESAVIRSIDVTFRRPIYLNETIVQKAHVRKKIQSEKMNCVEFEVLVCDSLDRAATEALVVVEFQPSYE